MGFPLVRAWSWGPIRKLHTRIGVLGLFPKVACLVRIFQFGFTRISLVRYFHWVGRSWFSPRFCPLGLSHGLLFLFLGCKMGFSLDFSILHILVHRFGGLFMRLGIGSGPSFMGEH